MTGMVDHDDDGDHDHHGTIDDDAVGADDDSVAHEDHDDHDADDGCGCVLSAQGPLRAKPTRGVGQHVEGPGASRARARTFKVTQGPLRAKATRRCQSGFCTCPPV